MGTSVTAFSFHSVPLREKLTSIRLPWKCPARDFVTVRYYRRLFFELPIHCIRLHLCFGMFCLSHLWTIWHIFLWDLQSIEIICNFFWTIWHIFLWDLQSIEIEVVLSPNYITVSNNICEEFIVNVVIRHYKYVKRHCKCNRMPGVARTLSLLIFYWVHSINMYSSGAWACI